MQSNHVPGCRRVIQRSSKEGYGILGDHPDDLCPVAMTDRRMEGGIQSVLSRSIYLRGQHLPGYPRGIRLHSPRPWPCNPTADVHQALDNNHFGQQSDWDGGVNGVNDQDQWGCLTPLEATMPGKRLHEVPIPRRSSAFRSPPSFLRSSIASPSFLRSFISSASFTPSTAGDGLEVSEVYRTLENSFDDVSHFCDDSTRTVPRINPLPPEVQRLSRDPTIGALTRDEGFEDIEICLRKTRRVLLPTPRTYPDDRLYSPPSFHPQARFSRGSTNSASFASSAASSHLNSATSQEPDRLERRNGGTMRYQSPVLISSSLPRNHLSISQTESSNCRPVPLVEDNQRHQQQPRSNLQPQHPAVIRDTPLGERLTGSKEANGTSGCVSSATVESDCQKDAYVCQICRVRCGTLENFDDHMQSYDHRRLMKNIANLHLRKTQQRLKNLKNYKVNHKNLKGNRKTLKVNQKNLNVNGKQWKFTTGVKDRKRWNLFGVKQNGESRTKGASDRRKGSSVNKRSQRILQGQAKGNISERQEGCSLPNMAKFLVECTLHRQNEHGENSNSTMWLPSQHNSERPNTSRPTGQECVVSVSGFLCKLCNKFYNDETSAKVTHCCSRKHIFKYREMLKMMKTFRETAASETTKDTHCQHSDFRSNFRNSFSNS